MDKRENSKWKLQRMFYKLFNKNQKKDAGKKEDGW